MLWRHLHDQSLMGYSLCFGMYVGMQSLHIVEA